jgi:hypothetical protein
MGPCLLCPLQPADGLRSATVYDWTVTVHMTDVSGQT